MANLRKILSDTMFMAAKRGVVHENEARESRANAMLGSGDTEAPWQASTSVWSYDAYDEAAPNVVTNLKCRGANGIDNVVCTEIAWTDIVVSLCDNKTKFVLDVAKKEFRLASYCETLQGGLVKGETLYLDADVHKSFIQVYGFVLDVAAGAVTPFSEEPDPVKKEAEEKAICDDENFIPSMSKDVESIDSLNRISEFSTSDDQEHVIAEGRARVVVCLEFICCGPRADWDPFSAVEAARIYPRIFIHSNVTLQSISGQVHLTRPTESSSAIWGHCNKEIKQAFFADQNLLPEKLEFLWKKLDTEAIPPSANWDDLFSYYDINPSSKEFVVVDPMKKDRTEDNKHKPLTIYSFYSWKPRMADPSEGLQGYSSKIISKSKRQGAFDNIHMAPTMKRISGPEGEQIVMAPVCIHDCFHTHWRWGANLSYVRHIKGWNDRVPYSVAGAPMVPLNQKITVVADHSPKNIKKTKTAANGPVVAGSTPIGPTVRPDSEAESVIPNGPTLHYIVNIDRRVEPADGWQIMMHHGSAYAYGPAWYTPFGFATKVAFAAKGAAEFYWDLRYVKDLSGIVKERLRWSELEDDGTNITELERLRDA